MINKTNNSKLDLGINKKKARKAILIFFSIAYLIAACLVTQYMAHKFNYHEALGFNIGHVYPPWNCLVWTLQWADRYPVAFEEIRGVAVTVFMLVTVITVFAVTGYNRNLKNFVKEDLYGSARWAEWPDIEKAGLLSTASDSVVVGGFLDKKGRIRYLRHSGPEHVLTFAPTRSGKGVSLVVPTMLSWSQSAVVTDLKGELWALTSGWRQKYAKNRVIKFEPTAEESVHWNPLDEIRYGQAEVVGDVQNLATIIVDPDGKGLNDHWSKTAFALLTGVILFVLRESHRPAGIRYLSDPNLRIDHGNTRTLSRDSVGRANTRRAETINLADEIGCDIRPTLSVVDRLLSISDPKQLWDAMSEDEYALEETQQGMEPEKVKLENMSEEEQTRIRWAIETHGISAIIRAAGNDMKARPPEEAGSVLSTAKSYLSLYRDPIVAKNISESEFRIRDLMYHSDNKHFPVDGTPADFIGGSHKAPATLYIVTQPNDKNRLRPLIRIMVNMIVRLLASRMEFEKGREKSRYDHRLLLMLDEFPSLGKLDILQESLAFISGYGLKAYLITQDINQLKSKETGYGEDESITSNCHVQNAFSPNRIETAEHLSKMAGKTTILKEEVSLNKSSDAKLWTSGVSENTSIKENQRELITPDECMRLKLPVKEGKNIVEPGEMLIFVAGYPAIKGIQPLYFRDPVMQKRAEVPAPEHTDRIRLLKPARELERIEGVVISELKPANVIPSEADFSQCTTEVEEDAA